VILSSHLLQKRKSNCFFIFQHSNVVFKSDFTKNKTQKCQVRSNTPILSQCGLSCAAPLTTLHLLLCLQIDSWMERYERPKLCRLCRCPVADGGVPLSQLDRPKLSEWWLQHLDTEFEDKKLENAWICQFCVWDARLVRNIFCIILVTVKFAPC